MKRRCHSEETEAPGRSRPLDAVAVLREPVFSPGMVEKDAAILRAAAEKLGELRGLPCPVLTVEELAARKERPDLVLSMAEGEDTLALMESLEAQGTLVLNSTASIRQTRRAALLDLARPKGPLVDGVLVATDSAQTDDGSPIPAVVLATGSVWIKRADYHALGPGDVVKSPASDVLSALRTMHGRGISRAVVQPHLAGEVVKFYGVLAADGNDASALFRWFALEGGQGPDAATAETLRASALLAAKRSGLTVFGGDAVLAPGGKGSPVLIDLNAWPSFWRCREDAAVAIARLAAGKLETIACSGGLASRHVESRAKATVRRGGGA